MQLRVMHAVRAHSFNINDISPKTTIDELRNRIAVELGSANPVSTVQLFCVGKLLDNGHDLWNYRIKNGMTILVRNKSIDTESNANEETDDSSSNSPPLSNTDESENGENYDDGVETEPAESDYFSVGQRVEIRDEDGAYNAGRIQKILKKRTIEGEPVNIDENEENDRLIYVCSTDGFADDDTEDMPLSRLRPRIQEKLASIDLIGTDEFKDVRYLVNYNRDEPKELGVWHEAELQPYRMDGRMKTKYVLATIYTVQSGVEIQVPNCKITKLDEIFVLPQRSLKSETEEMLEEPNYPSRTQLDCFICYDNPAKKPSCRYCLCVECRSDKDDKVLLVCEECHESYHTYCLKPPLTDVPDDDWYCPECKNDDDEIVKAGQGEKLLTKKRQSMPAAKTERRWGGKQSCDGRKGECTIVPKDHYGSIPGVEVGTCWRYRNQASAAGVHRPLVAGIHGKEKDGAYSIVVSGGYVDDTDKGDSPIYTGSGGRDLTGNKRVNKQTMNQKLDRSNAALALNCYSKSNKLDKENGGNAGKDWKKGKAIRVIRSCKTKEYGPPQGFRYDGIYKVKRYWAEPGRDGFIVWRYELARDDPTPAPWTPAGKMHIKKRGLEKMIEPDNAENKSTGDNEDDGEPSKKKAKLAEFEIPSAAKKSIKKDIRNKKLWTVCIEDAKKGSKAFFDMLTDVFACPICQEIVNRPITLGCSHSACAVSVELHLFFLQIYM